MRAGAHFMPDIAASLLSESCLSPVCDNTSGCATSCLAACEDVFRIANGKRSRIFFSLLYMIFFKR